VLREPNRTSLVLLLLLVAAVSVHAGAATWQKALSTAREDYAASKASAEDATKPADLWKRLARDFPLQADWMMQDAPGGDYLAWITGPDEAAFAGEVSAALVEALGADRAAFMSQLGDLSSATPSNSDWLDWYAAACERRRELRLQPLLDKWTRIVFTKHYNMGASHYAYTEGLSDAQHERHFAPGAALCVLEMEGSHGQVRTLLDDPNGVIRDPDVSHDGSRILFSWKKSDREDDYHLYDMDVATGDVRQLTFGLGFADYEPAYLPNGDIIFNSTRCVQIVDCWWTEVSNLYTCDKDGKHLRRLSFDQVHTNFPTVTQDGRVLYTRWDYNDRGQIYPQPLFQMNPDGTGQTECYGNNSWFPTTILHARDIPDSPLIVAVLSGHHSHQRGKLALIDTRKGRQEAAGTQLIAPVRETPAVHVDAYGQDGDQFQYPYPLDETAFLVTYSPYPGKNREYPAPYAIYFMTVDGRRELLASDPAISCSQSIPLAPRKAPHARPSTVEYRQSTGTYYVQDVYAGPGLAGVARGTIKKLRVVGLEFRAAGIRSNRNGGPAGGALVSTPVAIGNGCWDPKILLGEATVYEDGSACFTVPDRTPVYFQALDEKGYAVQTMRSWSTLQPGERFSCTGCHESKSEGPASRTEATLAMAAGPTPLQPFHGPPRGFSFVKEVQPILDRHCTRCHKQRADEPPAKDIAFSLLGTQTVENASGRKWSDAYLALTGAREQNGFLYGNPEEGVVRWVSSQSVPSMLPPYTAGAAKSPLIAMLEKGHNAVKLSRQEMETLACWIDLGVPYCGDYVEANAWSEEEVAKYNHFLAKRRDMAAIEQRNIAELIRESRSAK
jgi:Hydrazine synthase alpha subunit middle domain